MATLSSIADHRMDVEWLSHADHNVRGRVLEFLHTAFNPDSAQGFRFFSGLESADELPQSLFLNEGGRTLAHLALWPKVLALPGGGQAAVADIGAVVVAPEYRGQGLLYRLFAEAERRAVELGFQAMLLGGKPEIYSRMGFACCNKMSIEYEFPASLFHTHAPALSLEEGPPSVQLWRAIYERRLDGNLRIRKMDYWNNLVQSLAIAPPSWYCAHEVSSGSAIIVAQQGNAGQLVVRELHAPGAEAVHALVCGASIHFDKLESVTFLVGAGSVLDGILNQLLRRTGLGLRQISVGTQWKSLMPGRGVPADWFVGFLDRR